MRGGRTDIGKFKRHKWGGRKNNRVEAKKRSGGRRTTGEHLTPIFGLESGRKSYLKAKDRAKKRDRRDRAEKDK